MGSPPKTEWFPERPENDSDASWGDAPATRQRGGAEVGDDVQRYLDERPPHAAE